jgi:ribose-phosphate pyrophosphokinase
MEELRVFTGNAHPDLAREISGYLGISLGNCEVFQFSNENTFVRILENVRERDTFIVQPICPPVNSNLMELLIMIDAMKRASASRITAVIPYYAYGRSDKKDQPRVPITARLVADLLSVAGANRVLTVDLHKAQIQGFFNIPVDELTAFYLLGKHFRDLNLDNIVAVATDFGITKQARDIGAMLDAPLAIMEKRRVGNDDRTELLNVIGDVQGKTAIIIDEEIDTASSLMNVIDALFKRGARKVYACCTHPVFSGPAVDRIASSRLENVVVTNTVPVKNGKLKDKITVLSIAPILGEAIRRIHTGQSVGAMFEE